MMRFCTVHAVSQATGTSAAWERQPAEKPCECWAPRHSLSLSLSLSLREEPWKSIRNKYFVIYDHPIFAFALAI